MEGDYLSLFSQYFNYSPLGLIALYLLSLMRLAPAIAFAPFFGNKLAPVTTRVGLLLALALVFLPFLMTNVHQEIHFDTLFIGLALKEVLIGAFLGFLIIIPFLIVESSGILIDFLRGASILQAQDPTMQSQASPIGILYNYVLIVIFYEIDGPFLYFNALRESYALFPMDQFFSPLYLYGDQTFWHMMQGLLNHIMSISIQIAAPSLVAILMAEMFLGIANRLAPQVQIAFLGMSLKSLLGIALLFAAWFFVLKVVDKLTLDWIDKLIETMYQVSSFTKIGGK